MKTGIVIFSLLLPIISGCSGNMTHGDAENELISYENCFNDRYIVRTKDGYSIAGPDSVILSSGVYEELSFITDDLALGRDGNDVWHLMDKDGIILEKSIDGQYLSKEATSLYEAFVERNSSIWNEVLDAYENLCVSCLKGENTDDAVKALTLIEERSRLAGAKMSEEQRRRFERIEERYRRLRK